MKRIELTDQPRILVVALRRLGDVLLTTPLIRSLRHAWPDAHIDALVFADTAGILAGNPDLDDVVTMPPRPTALQSLALGARLWRKYDLAVSTQSGVAPVEDRLSGRIKAALLDRSIGYVHSLHRVEQMLRLADVLGIERVPEMVAPKPQPFEAMPAGPYAVIHAAPFFRYKQWTAQGWRDLAAALSARGLTVVASGGPAADEQRYLDEIWQGANVIRLDGKLNWPQLTGLLSKARVYVGPDTSVTHLAAATGCPTVAIYGPTDPRLWGPWPSRGLDKPWAAAGSIQHSGNVWLVQNRLPCMPCQLEGCERRLDSASACLDELPASRVIAAVELALA
jgi:heptosyltransferase-3